MNATRGEEHRQAGAQGSGGAEVFGIGAGGGGHDAAAHMRAK